MTLRRAQGSVEVRFAKPAGVTAAWARRVIAKTLNAEKSRVNIGALVTGDAEIRKLNKKFLKHDYATDVISFPDGSGGGDLVVSADYARRYARENGIPFREELGRYLVHGTLHLLGYDDKKAKAHKKMHGRQEAILKKIL